MSLLTRIKSLLPASSRSLHAMHYEIGQMHGQMGEMWAEVGASRIMLHNTVLPQLEALRNDLVNADRRSMLLLWELHRRKCESMHDTKRRVLEGLSPTTGISRLYQLASAQLLFEFDAFCVEHGLEYWLQSGTLLGAVRHQGFIPWDDDLDISMCRVDVDRAVALVADDPRYRITERYDWYVRCRQMRFRYADERTPCFIDIFVFDPVAVADKRAFVARETERAALESDLVADEELAEFWNARQQFVDEGTQEAAAIRKHFNAHIQALYDAGVLVSDTNKATGVIWGIDNVNSGVSHHSWYLIPHEAIWPLKRMSFEGYDVSVPSDYNRCLSDIFGDIYDLPHNVGSYFDHMLGRQLHDPEVITALREIVKKDDARTSFEKDFYGD